MCTFRLGFKVSTGTDSCPRWAATLRKQRLELPARWARSRTNAAITSMSTDENTGESGIEGSAAAMVASASFIWRIGSVWGVPG